jgi:hypothetical protein
MKTLTIIIDGQVRKIQPSTFEIIAGEWFPVSALVVVQAS